MMNLLVTLDSNYVMPLTALLRSLMTSNPGSEFTVYIAHSSLTEQDFEKINASVDLSRTKICPIAISSEMMADAPVLKRITKETYYRLLAHEYLPESVERVLYIDPDTVVIKPLDELYNIDFGDNVLAGSTHVFSVVRRFNLKRLSLPFSARYLNAGVLMMNIQKMRTMYSSEDIFEFIRLNSEDLLLGDQDVINALYGRLSIALKPQLYNCDEKICRRYRLKEKDVRRDTVIVHFNGSKKPWKEEKYKGILKPFWDEANCN